MADFFFPRRGGVTLQEIINYFKKIGVINVEYDSNLNGIVDLAEDSQKLGGLLPSAYQLVSEKGQPYGYAPLNASAQVPLVNIPPIPVTSLAYKFAWEFVGYVYNHWIGNVNITNLNGAEDKFYLLIYRMMNDCWLSLSELPYLQFNGDTGTDYAFGSIYVIAGATATTARSNTAAARIPVGTAIPAGGAKGWGIIFLNASYNNDVSAHILFSNDTRAYGVVNGRWNNPTPTQPLTSIYFANNVLCATTYLDVWIFKAAIV